MLRLVAVVALLELLGAIVLVGVVLVGVLVVLVVKLLRIVLGLLVSTDFVVLVHAVGLSQLVNLSTDEPSEELLGELVVNNLACSTVSGVRTIN